MDPFDWACKSDNLAPLDFHLWSKRTKKSIQNIEQPDVQCSSWWRKTTWQSSCWHNLMTKLVYGTRHCFNTNTLNLPIDQLFLSRNQCRARRACHRNHIKEWKKKWMYRSSVESFEHDTVLSSNTLAQLIGQFYVLTKVVPEKYSTTIALEKADVIFVPNT